INMSLVYIILKVLLCVVYVVRVSLDSPKEYACDGIPCNMTVFDSGGEEGFTSTNINWYVLIWVRRPLALWIVEVVLSLVTLFKTIMMTSITGKGNFFIAIASRFFFLELFCCVPVVLTILWPPVLQNIFFPTFLNCWLALMSLRNLLNDFHLAKQRFQTMSVTLSQQSWFLIASLCCLVFTTICGIQHIQRGSAERPLNLFESVYFVVVTLSTVGYGDISPDIWLGQLYMIIMICIAFSYIPRQVEEIGSTWAQRKRMGGDYSKRASARNKHVVVVGSQFTTESVMSFLDEFFEHPKLENYTVILMSSEELDDNMQFILKDPKWALRVLYIRGSALKDIDLKRCRINEAEACFFLVNKKSSNMEKSDQHTVLRSWAVKDFAPNCAQYIQLYKASNKIHVKFAEHVISEDEFKFALLANNCLYPGLSTLVTLILHSSKGNDNSWAPEQWQQTYEKHSGNEIYHIQLQRSVFFKDYEGKKFTFASADAHKKYGITLLAVYDSTALEAQLQLNPGPDYILKSYDYCFYMSLEKEENIKFSPKALMEDKQNTGGSLAAESREKNIALIVKEMTKLMEGNDGGSGGATDDESVFSTITSNMGSNLGKALRKGLEAEPLLSRDRHHSDMGSAPETQTDQKESFEREHAATVPSKIVQHMIDLGKENFTIGPPPSTLNLGTRRTLCHLHKEARLLCCLKWGEPCSHCSYKVATDRRWDNQLVILSVRQSCPGLYNFIIPLRSNYLSLLSLRPIIIMFEEVPTKLFLQTIANFPLVFWMQGALSNLDDLLIAGVHKAMHLVISHIETDPGRDENLSDAETIITVQKISRLFPHVNIITEVNEASNMRFMHFKPKDTYTLKIKTHEKKLKQQAASHLPHMFRLPFAAGQVFSSSMLDRLLYQTFVKGYLISFVRLLLGIDAEKDSGHLSSVRIHRGTLRQFPTYGDLFQGLASTTGEIPIAIYRTEKQNPSLIEGNLHGLPDGLGLKKKNNSLLNMLHIHSHQPRTRRNMRAARMSVAGFVDKDKNSNHHLEEMVQTRMDSLGLSQGNYRYVIEKSAKTLSYVIVNPPPGRKLKNRDMVYVIQPSSMQAVPNKLARRGGSLNKTARTRHISFNHPKLKTTTVDTSDYSSLGLGQSLTSIHASSLPSSPVEAISESQTDLLTVPRVVWFKVNGDTGGEQDADADDEDDNQRRPRCMSESYVDHKNSSFA
ncbi:unnamed protein product, partial [Candidula unifasciata]